jgi:hypothetical protein
MAAKANNHILRYEYQIFDHGDHLELDFPFKNNPEAWIITPADGFFISLDSRDMPVTYSIDRVRTPHASETRTAYVAHFIGYAVMEELDSKSWQGEISGKVAVSNSEYKLMLSACARAVEDDIASSDPSIKSLLQQY